MEGTKIKYDVPFEVTEKQYNAVMDKCSSFMCAKKDENGKYWVKVWLHPSYVKEILKKYA